jgi:hypothetical protein
MKAATAILLLLAACTSARERTRENHEEVSGRMAGELVHQLRERTDLRSLQVVVRDFDDRTGAERTFTKRNRVYFKRGETPQEFRQELIEALAPQVRVVDPKATVRAAPPSDDWGPATREAILLGEYSADEKRTVYLRARVVDAESRVVLATSEGIVRKD